MRRTGCDPSGRIVQTPNLPSALRRLNAIRCPFGANAGPNSPAGTDVSCVSFEPSASIDQMLPFREKAIVEPISCDCRSRANGGHRYPAHTRLRVPNADLELEITPWLSDQELEVSVRYWGVVEARATTRGVP